MTSVLLTSISAAWLVVIVCGRGTAIAIVGGIAAGLALAVDLDAIFFGTELRPYAAIVFLATAALAVARRLVTTKVRTDRSCAAEEMSEASRASIRDLAMRVVLHALVLFAAAVHITSLIVLAPQLLLFVISDVWRHCHASRTRRKIIVMHVAAGIAWMLIAVWWSRSHAGLWQSRGNWNSFATVQGWRDIWNLWPWAALALLPIAGWAVACGLRRGSWRRATGTTDVVMAALILGGVLASTIACYLLTQYAGVPLWHRRYLIASLPLMCAGMGWFIGAIRWSATGDCIWYRMALALTCILLLTYRQDTLSKWSRGDFQLVRRGENWKTAISMIRNSAVDGDRVWIDAGLIEQTEQPTLVSDAEMEEYLRYVTGGPYRLGEHARSIGIGRDAIDQWLNVPADAMSSQNAAPRFLITRRASRRLKNLPPEVARYRFGSVTVLLRQ